MGNYRSGNKYRVAIGLETSLGSGNTHSTGGASPTLSIRWEDLTVMPVKLELSPDRQMIDTNYKTGTSQATAYEQVQGVTDGTFTLSGKLSLDYEILLKAMFHQSPVDHKYTFDDTPPTAKSLVMMKVWDDAVVGSKYKVDIAKGCAVDSLVITGRSKEAIEFTMSGRITDHEREVEQVITGTDPGLTFPAVVQFGDIVYAGNFGEEDRLNEFTLTLTNIYIDDTKRYANSMSRLRDIILRQEGELNVKGLFKQ
ncbi:MAG TPA: phage tail tube protein, partial [Candidatus Cloacimonas sp.]|nr:phage tail tube protein [Candidatus Cloacimonas sp.]